jgi:hypothetical protein
VGLKSGADVLRELTASSARRDFRPTAAREERAGKSGKVSLRESTSRAGFQVALEASRDFLGFEGEIGFQLPRSMFGGVARDVGLVFSDPFT